MSRQLSSISAAAALAMFLYVGTGILQPILIDYLRINHCLGRHWLLLPTLANTLGMASCGLLSTQQERQHLQASLLWNNNAAPFKRMLAVSAAVDLVSGMMLTGGILLTGGAIFVVIYNSCPAWTALLSWCVLGKSLTLQQTLGVLLVVCGLLVNVMGTNQQFGMYSATVMGSIIVLVGSMLHSAFFILSEMSLRMNYNYCGDGDGDDDILLTDDSINNKSHHNHQQSPHYIGNNSTASTSMSISAPLWSCCLGSIEATCMTVWVLVNICLFGVQDNNDSGKNNTASCSATTFMGGFAVLLLVDGIHAAAFFFLLADIGAVGSALMKGLQACVVIMLSSVFYCSVEEAQCLSRTKAISIVLVLVGTLCYASAYAYTASGSRPDAGVGAERHSPGRPVMEMTTTTTHQNTSCNKASSSFTDKNNLLKRAEFETLIAATHKP
jgi:drug/metabolite transporter (DMT)-like permease